MRVVHRKGETTRHAELAMSAAPDHPLARFYRNIVAGIDKQHRCCSFNCRYREARDAAAGANDGVNMVPHEVSHG
jgi:hypothetical protein